MQTERKREREKEGDSQRETYKLTQNASRTMQLVRMPSNTLSKYLWANNWKFIGLRRAD